MWARVQKSLLLCAGIKSFRQQSFLNVIGIGTSYCHKKVIGKRLMSGSFHLDRASKLVFNVKYLSLLSFLTATEFYNLGHIQGTIRVH